MTPSLKYREMIADAQRVVVKIGSRVLVQRSGRPDLRRMRALVKELAALRKAGTEVVVVTSGAVAAGMEALRLQARPTTLPEVQMCAAVGQVRLMSRYADFFGAQRCPVGQVLLTHDDFHHKLRLTNARRTMQRLLKTGVIPIVNENDVVADEELRAELKKLGDNDLLAALVAQLVRADLLVSLTTSNGYCRPDRSGRMRRVSTIETINRPVLDAAGGAGDALSTGGMRSKLQAAKLATDSGCYVVLADGRKTGILTQIMNGADVGTLVPGSPRGS